MTTVDETTVISSNGSSANGSAPAKPRQPRKPKAPKRTAGEVEIRRQIRETLPRPDTEGLSSPIIPLLLIGAGAYLIWFGVRYWRSQGPAVWPSYPVKSILQGKGLPAPQPAATAAANVAAYEATLPQPITGGPAPPQPGGQPQNTARLLLARFGWRPDQMPPLVSLWNRESNWNPKARNPSSGALGIAQALGHDPSHTSAGSLGDEYGPQYGLTQTDAKAANSGSVLQQIRWGLGYIKSRYGSPTSAWAHEQSFGWY